MKNTPKALFSLLLSLINLTLVYGQGGDSAKVVTLKEVSVQERRSKNDIERLPEVHGTVIFAGKKTELIKVTTLDADLSTNNSRQLFSKVPGVTVWENDGSGIQTGVSTRGLSPNRSWEFNVRQNGFDISAEVFGYPEAYYTPPAEAVQSIEVVRGAASLADGPQFGGLLNYVLKKGDATKKISAEVVQTVGSYGLYNSFTGVGGTVKKFSYYGFFHHRNADGWRENSRYDINTGHISLSYAFSEKVKLGAEFTSMNYVSQQAGGLTDSLFNIDARRSLRSRNWMSTPWNTAAIHLDILFSERSRLSMKIFGLSAERNSVGFTKGINTPDTNSLSTGNFSPRQVDRDAYLNTGAEVRFLHHYNYKSISSALAVGLRAYNGRTFRRALGTGTTGSDYNLSVLQFANNFSYRRELELGTQNAALFAENLISYGKFNFTPGFRYEIIQSSVSGFIDSTAAAKLTDEKRSRGIFLLGAAAEFHLSDKTEIYSNYSQSYRPVTFSELTPSAVSEVIDPLLKDARGYSIDAGIRGNVKDFLQFDAGVFYLNYGDRIGTITSSNGALLRTNIGTSVSKGVEVFAEYDPLRSFNLTSNAGYIRLFASYAFVDARYTRWNNPALASDPVKAISGKEVENAPNHILRCGLTYHLKSFSVTLQNNFTSAVYTDAANTVLPNATATIGQLPGYNVTDLSLSCSLSKYISLRSGVNNLTDEKYATRRSTGYPGPGLLPGTGRTFYFSLCVKI